MKSFTAILCTIIIILSLAALLNLFIWGNTVIPIKYLAGATILNILIYLYSNKK